MAVWFRRAVSQSKRRFHQYGFDLDLTYVTPRIIGMCLPTEDLDAIYRNPLSEVVRFLDTFHKDHYKVFNFSMKKYDGLKYFHGNYVHYPFIDHNAPPFSLINTVCIDADAFLKEHPQNVVAFHCKAGKGRTGLMCACLLLYQREFINSHDAIDYYGTARTFNKDGVSIPSQLKYIHYWGNVLNNQRIVGKQSIKLTGIETTPFIGLNENITVVFKTHTSTLCERTIKPVLGSSRSKGNLDVDEFLEIFEELGAENKNISLRNALSAWNWKMRCHGQKGVESTLCDIDPVELCGDVKVIFQTATTELFNVWFNTWFVNKDVMTFTMIDFDNDTESSFNKKYLSHDFHVIFHFSKDSKRFSLTSIPDSVNGLKDVVTDDLHDDNNPSLVQEGEMENISVEALTALENETEATLNLQRRKAPFWYPIHNISLDFKNFDFLCEKLLTFPSNQKFLNIPSYLKDVNHSTRKPLEVSHALLYSIIQLYLRAGFLGRCFDYHIELIYFENKVGIKSFEQQAIELSTIDLTILQPEEFEPFWLNIYHIMLLHGLLYWKHRPIKNFKQLLLDFKNLKYNIGGLSYSLYEILMGNLRAPWPNDNSIGKVIIYQKGDERKKYVIPVADKDIGFLISFGTITSPGIWLYSVDEFNLQKDIAINTYLNRNSAALGDTKVLYIMDNMKLYIKDYGNERQMKNEILKRYNVNNIDNWNLKYQQEDYETRIILDHLIAQNIVITHQDMDYAEQSHLFRYEKPIIKNLNM